MVFSLYATIKMMHGPVNIRSLEKFVVLLTKYSYLFIYAHNGDSTFQTAVSSSIDIVLNSRKLNE